MSIDSIVGDLTTNEPRINEGTVSALNAKAEGEQDGNDNDSITPSQNGTPSNPTNIFTPPMATETVDAIRGSIPPEMPGTVRSSITNAYGESFDPSVHSSKPDGTPTYTTSGRFRKKRGGPEIVDRPTKPNTSVGPSSNSGTGDYRAASVAICGIGFGVAQSLFGEAWKPQSAEQSNIESAVETYFRAKGIIDLPPGIVVVLAVGAYALPRVNDPITRERFGGLMASIGLAKRQVKPVANTATPQPETPPNTPAVNGQHIKSSPFGSIRNA